MLLSDDRPRTTLTKGATTMARTKLFLITIFAILFALINPLATNSVAAAPAKSEYVYPKPWEPIKASIVQGVKAEQMKSFFQEHFSDAEFLKEFGVWFGTDKTTGSMFIGVPDDVTRDILLQMQCKPSKEACEAQGIVEFLRNIPFLAQPGVNQYQEGILCNGYQMDLQEINKVKVNGKGRTMQSDTSKCVENPPPPVLKAPECKTLNMAKQGDTAPITTTLTIDFNDPDKQVLAIRWENGDRSGGSSRVDIPFNVQHVYRQVGTFTAQAWLIVAPDAHEITSAGCKATLEVKEGHNQPPPTGEKCVNTVRKWSEWTAWQDYAQDQTKQVSFRYYIDYDAKDSTYQCGKGFEPRFQDKPVGQPPVGQPPVGEHHPSVTPDFGWDCRSLGDGKYSVWAYGKVVGTRYLEQLIGIMGNTRSDLFFGPSAKDNDTTEPLVLDDSLAIDWVRAPALKTGPYFFGTTIGSRETRWWPKASQWYDHSDVSGERYGWGYEVFGMDKSKSVKWQYEPISFPSKEDLIARGCITSPSTTEVKNPPEDKAPECVLTQESIDKTVASYGKDRVRVEGNTVLVRNKAGKWMPGPACLPLTAGPTTDEDIEAIFVAEMNTSLGLLLSMVLGLLVLRRKVLVRR